MRPAASRPGAGRSPAAGRRWRCAQPATTQSFDPCPPGPGADPRAPQPAAPPGRRRRRPARSPAPEAAGGATASGPSSSAICARSASSVALPDRLHASATAAAVHEASSAGSSGSRSSSTYSTGFVGIAATHAAAPSRNRRSIVRLSSSRPAAMRAPARAKPTTRASRSWANVRSAKISLRRPLAARSARSIWKSRSPAVTKPCPNHRSSSEAALRYGTPQVSRSTSTGAARPRTATSPSTGASAAAAVARSWSARSLSARVPSCERLGAARARASTTRSASGRAVR